MARNLINKSLLPLLSITVLLLSISLVSFTDSKFLSSQSSQNVLSENDENDLDEDEEENENEDKDPEIENNEDDNRGSNSGSGEIQVEEKIEIEDEDENDDEDLDEDDDEVETEFEQESEIATSSGATNRFKLKIKTKTVAGKTIIETVSGEVGVEKDPNETINDLVDGGLLDEPLSFEAKINNREKIEFEIQGTDTKKFLGIFKVVIPKLITVSSETGEVLSTRQNFWSRILSLLSV